MSLDSNAAEQHRPRVVMAGPLPPAIGGMATVISDICSSKLMSMVELLTFNTAKQTPADRPVWQGVAARLTLMWEWWKIVGIDKQRTVAHIHTCSGLTFFLDGLLLMLARLRGVPVVLHIHGGKFDKFLDGLNPYLKRLAVAIANKASKVVVLSEAWQAILSQRLPGSCFQVIHNGVHVPEEFVARSATAGAITVLYLGNLCQAKGVWDLVEAMRRLKGNVNLVLVGGDKEEGISAKIEAKLAEYELQTRVTLAGPCYGEDKQAWLDKSDIFVLPSYAEGLPISLLEAMAFSLPVIATTVGAIPMVIRDGEDGVLFKPGDVDALTEALLALVDDPALREGLSRSAYQRCSEHFSLENIANEYAAMFTEINRGR